MCPNKVSTVLKCSLNMMCTCTQTPQGSGHGLGAFPFFFLSPCLNLFSLQPVEDLALAVKISNTIHETGAPRLPSNHGSSHTSCQSSLNQPFACTPTYRVASCAHVSFVWNFVSSRVTLKLQLKALCRHWPLHYILCESDTPKSGRKYSSIHSSY